MAISIDTLGTGVSGGSELGGEEEVFDLGGSGIVDGEDEEDVDDELEDVEDIDDEDEELNMMRMMMMMKYMLRFWML